MITTQEILTIAGASVAGGALKLPASALKRALLSSRGLECHEESRFERFGLPIVMAIAGGLFAWRAGFSLRLVYLLLTLLVCTVIATVDISHRIIPNELILATLALSAIFGLTGLIRFDILSSLAGFACCFAVFMLPCALSKKVGAGDVKLAAAMGFSLGLTGSLYAIALMGALILLYTLSERSMPLLKTMKSLIPMGPFIAAAMLVVTAL